MDWEIARDAMQAIRVHARRAAPLEACGLLLGQGADANTALIKEARAAANVAEDPACRFEIDPAALFDAHRNARAGGPNLLGYYHSHPNGVSEPSRHDAARAAPDGKLWLVAGATVTAWIAADAGLHGRFRPIRLIETG